MLLILRARGDPSAQRILLLRRERAFHGWRRHQFVFVSGEDTRDQFALVRLSRHERNRAGLRLLRRGVAEVEPQSALPRLVIRPVAFETVLREDRPHVAAEVRRVGGEQSCRGENAEQGCCDFHVWQSGKRTREESLGHLRFGRRHILKRGDAKTQRNEQGF